MKKYLPKGLNSFLKKPTLPKLACIALALFLAVFLLRYFKVIEGMSNKMQGIVEGLQCNQGCVPAGQGQQQGGGGDPPPPGNDPPPGDDDDADNFVGGTEQFVNKIKSGMTSMMSKLR